MFESGVGERRHGTGPSICVTFRPTSYSGSDVESSVCGSSV
jgi:hypothetical protein